ncbi:MAG: translocation/assembly module TamB domain-containing protein [Candidatus Hydrogenedentota bacterium]
MKWFKRALKLMAFVVVLLLVLSLFLQMPYGKRFLSGLLSKQLSGLSAETIHVGAISGFVPFAMSIDRVEIEDLQGQWLSIRDLSWQLSPSEMIFGRVTFALLRADSMNLSALPQRRATKENAETASSIPEMPAWLTIQKFAIDQINIDEEVFGRSTSLTVSGRLINTHLNSEITLSIHAHDLQEPGVNVAFFAEKQGQSLVLNASLHDDIYLPERLNISDPISIQMTGAGLMASWAGELGFSIGDEKIGVVVIEYEEDSALRVRSIDAISLTSESFPSFVSDLLGSEISLDAMVDLTQFASKPSGSLSLLGSTSELNVSGSFNIEEKFVNGDVMFTHFQLSRLSDKFEVDQASPAKFEIEVRGEIEEVHSSITAWSDGEKVMEGDAVIHTSSPFAIQGKFKALANSRLWSEEFQAFFSDDIEMSLDLNYDQETDNIVVREFELSTTWAKFGGTGSSTWKEKTIDGTVNASINNLDRLNEFLGIDLGGRATLSAEMHGTTSDFRNTTHVAIHDFEVADVRVSSIELLIEAQGKDWTDAFETPVSLHLEGSSESIQINGQTQPRIDFVADGSIPNRERLIVDKFSLDDQNTHASGNADVNFPSRETAVHVEARSNDIAAVTSLFDGGISGGFEAALQLISEAGSWHGVLNMQLDEPDGLPRGLSELAGRRVRADVQGTFLDDVFTINSADLEGQFAQLTGTGRYHTQSRDGTLHGDITIPDLGVLNSENSRVLAGYATAEISVDSTGEQFEARLNVNAGDVRFNEKEIETAQIRIDVNGESSKGEGFTHVSITHSGEIVEAENSFHFDRDKIVVPKFSITNRNNVIEGNAEIVYADSRGRVSLDALMPDLSSLQPFIGMPLQGSIDGKVEFDGLGGTESFGGLFSLHDFSTSVLSTDSLTVSWRVEDVLTSPHGRLLVSGSEMALDQITVQEYEFSGNLAGGVSDIELELAGKLNSDIPWSASAHAKLHSEEMRIDIERFQGNIDQYAFRLVGATVISVDEQQFVLNSTQLQLADGTIDTGGIWSENLLNVHSKWESIPLSILELFGIPIAQGTMDGMIDLSGTPEAPHGEMSIRISDFRTQDMMHQSNLPSVFASSEISLYNDTLTINSTVDASAKNTARMQLSVPARISLSPLKVEESTTEDWSGSIHYNADIDSLPALLNWDGSQLTGQIEGNFDIYGSTEHPQLKGKTIIRNGKFEHADMGSVIENISIELVADGNTLEIVNATATDDAGGTLTAKGELQLQPDEQFPFHFHTEVTNMSVVYQDNITSSVDGSIGIAGDLDDMEIVGDLRLGPTTIILRPDESATVVELAVLERKGNIVNSFQPEFVESQSNPIRLNISITIPGRAFVLATDMRTEWQGLFSIGGTTLAPTLQGELQIVQGYIAILGRRFTIDESAVIFDKDTSPPMPYFNIAASATREGITARITLRGSEQEMTMELTSDPVMPMDEILSLLLFGRTVTQITPVQALQLARAAALFSGSAKGLPFFSGPSRIKGIDTFDVKMGEEAPVVGVGKYLADGVFLEIEQGAGAESSRARVEIELLPTLKLQTSVGGNSQGGIGLFWKRDY